MNSPRPFCKRVPESRFGSCAEHVRKGGFSLVELLVVFALLAALFLLALPVFSQVKERFKASQCLYRMQKVGALLHGHVAENNGKIKLFIDGSLGGERRWYNLLKVYTGFSESEARLNFGCPSFKPDETNDWFCYGIRVNGTPGQVLRDTPDGPRFYNLVLSAVEEPGSFFWMGDSVSATTGRQAFRIRLPAIKDQQGIHLRHRGRANVLFLDGHIESLDGEGLAKVGVSEAVNEAGEAVAIQ